MTDKELIKNVPIVVDLKDFLRAFYQDDKTMVFFRTFSDKAKNGAGKNYQEQIRNADGLIEYLHTINVSQERGVFFVVNGGGHKDEDVLKAGCCIAQFAEIDDKSIEEQLELINAFPLRPSVIVRTRKSLHCYWLLIDGDIKRFRQIQKRLIAYFHSDKSIKNESRVMRLPGFFHCKEEPIKVEVIHFEPDRRYTQDELEAVLPMVELETDILEKKDNKTSESYKPGETTQKVPHGERYPFLVQKTGVLVHRLYGVVSKEAILEMLMNIARNELDLSVPLASGWDGLQHNLEKLIDDFWCAKEKELEDGTAKDLWRYCMRAWHLEHPGEQLSYPIDWDEIKASGERLKAQERQLSEKENESTSEVATNKASGVEQLYKFLVSIKPHKRFKRNDRGNGELYAKVFRKCLRWNTTEEKWLVFDGRVWSLDEGGMRTSNLAKQLYDALLIYAAKNIDDEEAQKQYVRHIGSLGDRSNRESMIKDARDFYFIDSSVLDADGDLLNCQNGIVNLRTRELLAHDPELFQSKICNVSYDPNIRSDLWEWFVADIMFGDVEKMEYLQKLSGYILLGNSVEEELYFLNGITTRNGKTTFIETLAYMLGNDKGYALKVDPKSLGFSRYQNPNAPRGDIARLRGCRLAYTSEPDKQLTLDAGLLKQMSGGNVISARFNHKENFQFEPNFKLVIDCNNLPLITDSTLFDSDRIRVITFDKHIPEEERDKTLKVRLREPDNLSGILNWCLDGLEMYLTDGLTPPEVVVEATNSYRDNSDKLGAFICERLEESDNNCSGKDAYKEYQRWCRENSLEIDLKGVFFADMRARGILKSHGTLNGHTEHNVIIGYEISR